MSPYSHNTTPNQEQTETNVSFRKESLRHGGWLDIYNAALAACNGKCSLLASYLEISDGALSKKKSGEIGWSAREIDTMISMSGLTVCDTSIFENIINGLKIGMQALLQISERNK